MCCTSGNNISLFTIYLSSKWVCDIDGKDLPIGFSLVNQCQAAKHFYLLDLSLQANLEEDTEEGEVERRVGGGSVRRWSGSQERRKGKQAVRRIASTCSHTHAHTRTHTHTHTLRYTCPLLHTLTLLPISHTSMGSLSPLAFVLGSV